MKALIHKDYTNGRPVGFLVWRVLFRLTQIGHLVENNRSTSLSGVF